MQSRQCAYCGSTDMVDIEEDFELSEPYAGTTIVKIHVVKCGECCFTEDDDANDIVVAHELAVLKRKSMVNILTDLNRAGYSNASMERILGLPMRTLARWKNDSTMSPSAAGIALMRIVRTFPWILEVVDARFDREKTKEILSKAKV